LTDPNKGLSEQGFMIVSLRAAYGGQHAGKGLVEVSGMEK